MADEIEQYQLSEAEDSALAVERQRLIETVLAQLGASGNSAESVEDDLSPDP
jgi:transcription elongation GreA/GreB family factor